MSAATMSTDTFSRPAPLSTDDRLSPAVRRPTRRPGPTRGPVARPVRGRLGPTGRSTARAAARACRVAAVEPAGPSRLTDRGIAVVLVLGAMIVVAGLTMVGLTAWQVTGSDVAGGSTVLVSPR